jgi:hypothetical protein
MSESSEYSEGHESRRSLPLEKQAIISEIGTTAGKIISEALRIGIIQGPPEGHLFKVMDDLIERVSSDTRTELRGLVAQLLEFNELREKIAMPHLIINVNYKILDQPEG